MVPALEGEGCVGGAGGELKTEGLQRGRKRKGKMGGRGEKESSKESTKLKRLIGMKALRPGGEREGKRLEGMGRRRLSKRRRILKKEENRNKEPCGISQSERNRTENQKSRKTTNKKPKREGGGGSAGKNEKKRWAKKREGDKGAKVPFVLDKTTTGSLP